ncbi:ORF V: Enzymatic polyprotein [Labeo rohita]|uniref:ORF V: Enzymatic polyprotein n=1 Tax=Labeo rohita TaxID=84645 RepID=A0ABQ8MA22_LABRO|nr:ORF V: Enzymatic polyprotein [Labeo rohita]
MSSSTSVEGELELQLLPFGSAASTVSKSVQQRSETSRSRLLPLRRGLDAPHLVLRGGDVETTEEAGDTSPQSVHYKELLEVQRGGLQGDPPASAGQANLLKELDEGEEVRADNFFELRRTADLSLHATKETTGAASFQWVRPILVGPRFWLCPILDLCRLNCTVCISCSGCLLSSRLCLRSAQSEQMAAQCRDVVLAHMKELGLRLNAKKSVLSPVQRTTYPDVVWDSTTMQARLSPAQIELILTAVKRVKTLAVVAQDQGVFPEGQPTLRNQGHVALLSGLRHVEESLAPILGPGAGSSLLLQNANDGCAPHWLGSGFEWPPGPWRGRHLMWHIYCLEMLAVFNLLKNFLLDLRGHHVLLRSDNTAVVSYINHQGGLQSRPLYRLAHQILLWAQGKLLSLRAVHIPGHLNQGADVLSRQGLRPREWKFLPQIELFWAKFGQAQVDLFATQEKSHCSLWFCLNHPAPLELDAMVQMWLRLCLYTFPLIALLPGVLERVRQGWVPSTASSPILTGPSMTLRPDFSPRRLSMGYSYQEGSPLMGRGQHLLPLPGVVEAVGVAPEGAQLIASSLSTEIVRAS